jgi:FkbM family methyltransferase
LYRKARHGPIRPLERANSPNPTMSSRTEGRAKYKFRSFCWKLLRRVRSTVTIPTKQGLLTVDCADRYIAKSLYCRREYELDLMLLVTSHLRAAGMLPAKGQGTFLDIGANMGVTCVGMLTAGEFERAVAIEPGPRNFELLRRNVEQNGLAGRIHCLHCAVSDRSGTLQLELSDTNFGDHRVRTSAAIESNGERFAESRRRVIEIESKRLDDVAAALPAPFAGPIALVWMDVQGYEGHVIQGGARIFGSGAPLATEIWPYGIRRSGMTQERFCDIVRSTWPSFWMLRGQRHRQRFVRYPTSVFDTVFDELGFEGAYDNVLLTR